MRSEWRFRHTLVSPDGFRRVLGQIKAEFPPNLLDACYLFGVGLRKSVAVLLFSRRRGPYQRTGELKQMRSPDFIVKIAADSRLSYGLAPSWNNLTRISKDAIMAHRRNLAAEHDHEENSNGLCDKCGADLRHP